MTSIPKLREASMVQNTTQDASEEIIDLTEIIQKGKIPSGSAKKGIDFDSALSDLQETAKTSASISSPGLDDLLAGLEDPLIAPSDKAEEQRTGLETPSKDAFDELAEPVQPEVPSFDSLFADLDLSAPTKPAPDEAVSFANAASAVQTTSKATPASSNMADNAVSNLFTESIPGLDDVDALISKLDVPPSGGKKNSEDSQHSLDESSSAPADLDSLLDSLLSAGGGKVQPQKIAKGQPKEISEEDLDDLLSSIEVESTGSASVLGDASESDTDPFFVQELVPEETPLVDLHPEKTKPEADALMETLPDDEASADSMGEETIEALFDALNTVSLEEEAQATRSVQDPQGDALLPVDHEHTVPAGDAENHVMPDSPVLEQALPDVPLLDMEPPASQLEVSMPEDLTPEDPVLVEHTPESLTLDLANLDVVAEGIPNDITSDTPNTVPDEITPDQDMAALPTPSLADVLTGKVLNMDDDEPSDALFAGFDAPEYDLAEAQETLSATNPTSDQLFPTTGGIADDLDFDPATVLAGVDALNPVASVAPAMPAEQLSMPATIDNTPVIDELLERISVLEAELTLMQSRVDALENTASGEDLQSQLMDLLVDGTPFHARCVELVQGLVTANIVMAQANQATVQSQRENELEQRLMAVEERQRETALVQRLLAVEERQNDLDWGRQQGVSELENRFSEFENRFDLNARMEPLEERLAALEKKQRATDLEKRLATLEQSMANVPVSVEPLAPERMAEQVIELLRVDIDRAAAESAARVLREEIAALFRAEYT